MLNFFQNIYNVLSFVENSTVLPFDKFKLICLGNMHHRIDFARQFPKWIVFHLKQTNLKMGNC